ncbi:hypothetical protein ACOME3_010548 [Neoechinorhynchus agilis]
MYCHRLQRNVTYGPVQGSIRSYRCPVDLIISCSKYSADVPRSWLELSLSEKMASAIINDICYGALLNPSFRVMVCGYRQMGKSTFVRLAANSLLSHFSCVRVLDLDPGKSMFTPPGNISLSEVRSPFYFNEFSLTENGGSSQLDTLATLFVGYDNVFECFDHYIRVCESLIKTAARLLEQAPFPMLVNTMGWMHGFGIEILKTLENLINPNLKIKFAATSYRQDDIYENRSNIKTINLKPIENLENLKVFNSQFMALNGNLIRERHARIRFNIKHVNVYSFERPGKQCPRRFLMTSMIKSTKVALCCCPLSLDSLSTNVATSISSRDLKLWSSRLYFLGYASVERFCRRDGIITLKIKRSLWSSSAIYRFNCLVLPGMREKMAGYKRKRCEIEAFIADMDALDGKQQQQQSSSICVSQLNLSHDEIAETYSTSSFGNEGSEQSSNSVTPMDSSDMTDSSSSDNVQQQ